MSEKQTTKTKGGARAGSGRKPGSPNKVTQEFRETITRLLETNAGNFAVWVQQVANGHGDTRADPAKALDLLSKLAEFAAPKLGRVEHTGADGGPVQFQKVTRTIIDPK